MAATGKGYLARQNYRFLSTDRGNPIMTTTTTSDSVFELDESDIWNHNNSTTTRSSSSSDQFRKSSNSRLSKKTNKRTTESACDRVVASSLPVNVPDWSKILREDYRENRWRENDGGFDEDDNDEGDDCDGGDGGNRIPPHEFLARQMARTRIASFSVHEGIGRTLKGRDLSRVRNAIFEKTGFQD